MALIISPSEWCIIQISILISTLQLLRESEVSNWAGHPIKLGEIVQELEPPPPSSL